MKVKIGKNLVVEVLNEDGFIAMDKKVALKEQIYEIFKEGEVIWKNNIPCNAQRYFLLDLCENDGYRNE
jgi:hypothetical protein